MSNFEKVKEFQEKRRENPTGPLYMSDRDTIIWLRLIAEEVSELHTACANQNIYDIADALGDILYVTYGMGGRMGLPMDKIFDEIHRSNMTKSAKSINGKILKDENYSPPKIKEVIYGECYGRKA